jgi:hypothetical protein
MMCAYRHLPAITSTKRSVSLICHILWIQYLIVYSLAATCFGHTNIFRWKYTQIELSRLATDPLFLRVFVNMLDYGDRFLVTTEIAVRKRKSLTLISYTQQDAKTQGKIFLP